MNSQQILLYSACCGVILGSLFLTSTLAEERSSIELPAATVEKLFHKGQSITKDQSFSEQSASENTGASQVVGEDIGQQGEDDQLLVVKQQMEHHLALMKERATGATVEGVTPLQFDILQRLGDILARQQKTLDSQTVVSPAHGQAGQEAGVGMTGDTVTSDASGNELPAEGDPLEAAWNQLPPSVQIPLRESAAKPFLPGYEQLLHKFYQNLKRN